jgi:hypothetical protein
MRLLLPALLACAAAVLTAAPTPTPTPISDFSVKAARADAARDIAAGHLKIYLAGGIALTAPGIGEKDESLVAKLPRDHSLPAGCTAPHAPEAYTYATAYNEAIVDYLRKKAR